jgi:3-oxoacyl-[acyl-carrier protein] reductase/meso-butanediol dehydrogenase/(S,S)-butanediol dehydrogenase/diacetyl reductase
MARLDGKVALITGAGGMKGIGRACALELAALGADVAISDFKRAPQDLPPQEVKAQWRSIDSVAEEVAKLGRRCFKVWCDLTDTACPSPSSRRRYGSASSRSTRQRRSS